MQPKCSVKLHKGFEELFVVGVVHPLGGGPYRQISANKSELRDGTMQFRDHRLRIDNR